MDGWNCVHMLANNGIDMDIITLLLLLGVMVYALCMFIPMIFEEFTHRDWISVGLLLMIVLLLVMGIVKIIGYLIWIV